MTASDPPAPNAPPRRPPRRPLSRALLAAAMLAMACAFAPPQALAERVAAATPEASKKAVAKAMEPTPFAGEAAIAVDARIVEKGGMTRLQFDLSRAVRLRAFVLADPDRVVLDLPEVSFRIEGDRNAGAGKGLVRSYRYGQFAPGRSRVVVDLARPAKIVAAGAAAFAADGEGPARLILELAPESASAFRAQARRDAALARAADERAPAPLAARPSEKPVVVIDPGHGGIDSGAISRPAAGPETLEKDVVLGFARDLVSKLRADGRFTVTMTRDSDVFVPLDDRVKIARAAGAALFVSIHADSLRNGQGVSGATVYTLSDRASDAEAASIAENENAADRAAGVDAGESAGDVADILFDLTRRETRVFSNTFSRELVGRMGEVMAMHKIPSRAAGFRVLKAPDVPSVLIELGYLSSARDVEAMTSPAWRERSSAAVARAIESFMAEIGRAGPPPSDATGSIAGRN